jgi:hypothetical protein
MDPLELQKQVAELMNMVKEERQLRQAAEAAQLQVEKAAEAARQQAKEKATEAAAAITTAVTASKGPNIAVPDKFDGTRGVKAEVYANQVGLYVISHPTLFPDNRSRIIFSLSYLTRPASAWAQPLKAIRRRRHHIQGILDGFPSNVL